GKRAFPGFSLLRNERFVQFAIQLTCGIVGDIQQRLAMGQPGCLREQGDSQCGKDGPCSREHEMASNGLSGGSPVVSEQILLLAPSWLVENQSVPILAENLNERF